MHVETEFKEACRYFLRHGRGAFYTDDGAMVSGDFANYESETDSPNGIANVSILDGARNSPGRLRGRLRACDVPRHRRCRRRREMTRTHWHSVGRSATQKVRRTTRTGRPSGATLLAPVTHARPSTVTPGQRKRAATAAQGSAQTNRGLEQAWQTSRNPRPSPRRSPSPGSRRRRQAATASGIATARRAPPRPSTSASAGSGEAKVADLQARLEDRAGDDDRVSKLEADPRAMRERLEDKRVTTRLTAAGCVNAKAAKAVLV